MTGQAESIPGADSRIEFSDCLKVVRDAATGAAWVDRVLESKRGFRWDAPGTRVRFRTDSEDVLVRLRFSARHIGPSRNSIGFYRVDGRDEERFTRPLPAGGALPADADLDLKLPNPGDGGFHDYELILPYGDAVDVLSVEVAPQARWEKPAPRPAVRWVAHGDSVTQGFTASHVLKTYPFQVAETKGWQVINEGIGGRGCVAADGDFLAGVEAEIFSVAIGVNDWQGGTELAVFRKNMTELLQRLRAGHPNSPVYVITPLWVPPSWKPAQAKYPLEEYRKIISEIVQTRIAGGDVRMKLVDGPALIDADPALFDKVAVHPNDAGFAQMADRLARLME